MNGETDLVTVYRSADMNAETDARAVCNLLAKAGLNAKLLDDKAAGVVEGTWEVRVAVGDVPRAEELLASVNQDEPEQVSPGHELDLVTLADTEGGTLSEIEGISLKSILDAAGINNVLVGTSTLPNLGFDVRVPRSELERARQVVAEAREAGPSAALEAEQQTEAQG